MEKIKLDIVGLSYSQTQSGAYALVLGESTGKRRLPIIIGGFEAQAIAIELEKMTPSRPLTHDLFKNFADEFDIHVQEVIIYNLVEGIFFDEGESDGVIEEEVDLDELTKDPVETFTLADLEQKMQEAISNEDYEMASKIRDEINRRKSN